MDNMKWYDLWREDKNGLITIMYRNIADDLNAGYDPRGAAITRARAELDDYIKQFDAEARRLQELMLEYADGPRRVNRWCYMDLKRRGAID